MAFKIFLFLGLFEIFIAGISATDILDETDLTSNLLEEYFSDNLSRDENPFNQKNYRKILLCGRNLYRAIALTCSGKRKKSVDYYPDQNIINGDTHGMIGRFYNTNLLRNIYKRGGASQECCERPCTQAHLKWFC